MPTNLLAVNINRTTADVTWVLPRLIFGTETYVIQYGMNQDNFDMETDIVFSGLDTTPIDQLFSVSLENLQPHTMYYYRVVATNIVNSTISNIERFSTGRLSQLVMCTVLYYVLYCFFVVNFGPPTNFEIVVTGTETLTFIWDAPYDSDDLEIVSYTLFCHPRFQDEISIIVPIPGTITLDDEFLPGTTYTCSVYGTNADGDGLTAIQTSTTREGIYSSAMVQLSHSSYHICTGEGYLPFLVLGNTPGVERMYLQPEDDGASEQIELVGGLPIADTIHTRAYVRYIVIFYSSRLIFLVSCTGQHQWIHLPRPETTLLGCSSIPYLRVLHYQLVHVCSILVRHRHWHFGISIIRNILQR